jgi:hypothetical protein
MSVVIIFLENRVIIDYYRSQVDAPQCVWPQEKNRLPTLMGATILNPTLRKLPYLGSQPKLLTRYIFI